MSLANKHHWRLMRGALHTSRGAEVADVQLRFRSRLAKRLRANMRNNSRARRNVARSQKIRRAEALRRLGSPPLALPTSWPGPGDVWLPALPTFRPSLRCPSGALAAEGLHSASRCALRSVPSLRAKPASRTASGRRNVSRATPNVARARPNVSRAKLRRPNVAKL